MITPITVLRILILCSSSCHTSSVPWRRESANSAGVIGTDARRGQVWRGNRAPVEGNKSADNHRFGTGLKPFIMRVLQEFPFVANMSNCLSARGSTRIYHFPILGYCIHRFKISLSFSIYKVSSRRMSMN